MILADQLLIVLLHLFYHLLHHLLLQIPFGDDAVLPLRSAAVYVWTSCPCRRRSSCWQNCAPNCYGDVFYHFPLRLLLRRHRRCWLKSWAIILHMQPSSRSCYCRCRSCSLPSISVTVGLEIASNCLLEIPGQGPPSRPARESQMIHCSLTILAVFMAQKPLMMLVEAAAAENHRHRAETAKSVHRTPHHHRRHCLSCQQQQRTDRTQSRAMRWNDCRPHLRPRPWRCEFQLDWSVSSISSIFNEPGLLEFFAVMATRNCRSKVSITFSKLMAHTRWWKIWHLGWESRIGYSLADLSKTSGDMENLKWEIHNLKTKLEKCCSGDHRNRKSRVFEE